VTGALIIASVCVVDPKIAGSAAGVLAGCYVSIYMLARRRLLANGALESTNIAQRTRIVNESLGAIKEITLLGQQGLFSGRFAHSSRTLARVAANTQAIAQSPRNILEVIAIGGLVGISLLLIDRGAGSGPRLAQLAFLGFAAYRLLPALQQIYHSTVKIRADRVAFSRLSEDLRAASRPRERRSEQPEEALWRGRPRTDIRLQGVSFRYSAERTPAIREATLRIHAGAFVGIAGASGSGKTTLADLILGLLVPASGTIEVDGVALEPANLRHWHASVAYVPQEIVLLDASLAENIALGVAVEKIDPQRLRHAARLAQLEHFVEALPQAYAETVGERGVRLSGGQRQRIGIARALYRDASVLVMDEATNALDRLTEGEIIATLQEFRSERTVILITHRLDTLRQCDQIFELDAGTVIDSGTYGELRLRSAQFRGLPRGREAAS
jgi:ABC-type bacteriocin/lantibiotic exporter with double-glycine peptidase domain